MTKEEMQILSGMLESLKQDIKNDVKEELKPINSRLDKIEIETSKIPNIESSLRKLEVKIENETDRFIKIIAEGHGAINRKLDEALGVRPRVESVENRVSAVEYILKK